LPCLEWGAHNGLSPWTGLDMSPGMPCAEGRPRR
jgi:hypothetical protein